MNQKQIIQTLEGLIPSIKKGAAPEDVLLKYAHDTSASRAILEKMGQVYNTLRTVNFLDAVPSEKRGFTFQLIDVPSLVKRYTESLQPETKSASFHREYNSSFDRMPSFFALEKLAATHAPEPRQSDRVETQIKLAHLPKELAKQEQVALEDLEEDAQEQARRSLTKMARIVREQGPMAFVEMEQDMQSMIGTKAAGTVFDELARLCANDRFAIPVKRAAECSDIRRLATDRHGIEKLASDAADALEFAKACVSFAKEAGAGGAAGTDTETPLKSPNPSPGGPTGTAVDDLAEQLKAQKALLERLSKNPPAAAPDSGGSKFDPQLGTATGVAREGMESGQNALTDILSAFAPGENKRQRTVDRAKGEIRSRANVQRLLLSDPIISEANPETVMSIYGSLRNINPAMAQDVNTLRFALREALQYEGIPQHTLKDLVEIREKQEKGTNLAEENRHSRYDVKPPASSGLAKSD